MSSRFVVVRMKDIIKKLVFILIGAAVLGAIMFYLISGKDKSAYIPGTYSSEIILNSEPVVIEVTVDESEIKDIAMLDLSDTQAVFYPLFEPSFETVKEEILKKQSPETETEKTSVTASVIAEAVREALKDAAVEKETNETKTS